VRYGERTQRAFSPPRLPSVGSGPCALYTHFSSRFWRILNLSNVGHEGADCILNQGLELCNVARPLRRTKISMKIHASIERVRNQLDAVVLNLGGARADRAAALQSREETLRQVEGSDSPSRSTPWDEGPAVSAGSTARVPTPNPLRALLLEAAADLSVF
jgi:hypothetical protein